MQMQAYGIRELVVAENLQELLAEQAMNLGIVLSVEENEMATDKAATYVEAVPTNIQHACRRLLAYVHQTQMRSLSHIQAFTFNEMENYLRIDSNSKRNLELIQSIRGGDQKGTLLWLLDDTVTAMGGRKLKQWLHQPLASRTAIEARLEVVTDLLEEYFRAHRITSFP